MLNQLLEYHEKPPEDDFVRDVMRAVKRQQRIRKLILSASGFIGAVFAISSITILAEPVRQLLSGPNVLAMSIGTVAVAGIMTWLFYDDAGLTS